MKSCLVIVGIVLLLLSVTVAIWKKPAEFRTWLSDSLSAMAFVIAAYAIEDLWERRSS